MTHDVL